MLKVKTPYDYWGEIRHPVKLLCPRHKIVEVVHEDSKSDNEHQQSQDLLPFPKVSLSCTRNDGSHYIPA